MDPHLTHTMLITMVVAIAAGVILIAISHRLNLSAVVLLLLGGFCLGPEVLDIVRPEALGNGLPVIVSLAIGLILFEGGLTLNLDGYRSASAMIQRLLTVGTLTTWLTTTAAIWLIFRFDFFFSLLSASLVIVTGPTVITPLLKRIKVNANLHSILHWEGVLIDPVGVFIAILCYEWIGDYGRGLALVRFVIRFIWGAGLGLAGGLVVYRLIRSKFVPDDMTNVFALACAVLIFGGAEALYSESGLLAVTVSGFVLGLKQPGELKAIRQFKAEITDLLIGTLFILLSARLELEQFDAFGLKGALLVGAVSLFTRPLNVLLSSWGLTLNWREKAFLSGVAPRGIVAASMASLFTLNLQQRGVSDAAFIETFTYSVIVTTVLLHSFTAGLLARVLKVRRPSPTGWLVVGAHRLGRQIAHFIAGTAGHQVVLIDTNPNAVSQARAEGLVALFEDARDLELEEEDELQGVGNLLALTDNEDLNLVLCQRWADVFGRNRVFYWRDGPDGAAGFAGRAVWDGLPKPSHLSGELERGEAVLVPLAPPLEGADAPFTPLLALRRQRVALLPGHKGKMPDDEPDALLLLRREADYLVASLHPECVVRLDATDRDALFEQLVARVAQEAPDLPVGEIVTDLAAREAVFPTALGHGVAVPHAYHGALSTRICAVAQVPGGVDFGAPDGEPVRLVFLVLSPPYDPEGHLETMAEIARMAGNEETREQMLSASDPSELLSVIRNFSG